MIFHRHPAAPPRYPVLYTGIEEGVAIAGILATVASTAVAYSSAQQAGALAKAQGQAQQVAAQEQQQAADYQAAELKTQAGQDQAVAQRAAEAERQKEALVLSSDRAFAAGGGGASTDPGVVNIEGQVGARGEYNALSDLFTGNMRAAGETTQANLDIYTGQQYSQAGDFAASAGAFKQSMAQRSALGSIFGGIGQGASLYAKYGMPRPTDPTLNLSNNTPNAATLEGGSSQLPGYD